MSFSAIGQAPESRPSTPDLDNRPPLPQVRNVEEVARIIASTPTPQNSPNPQPRRLNGSPTPPNSPR